MKKRGSMVAVQSWHTRAQPDGAIWVPSWFDMHWRLGQRLYFSKTARGLLIGVKAQRTIAGRLVSSRVHRMWHSLRTVRAPFGQAGVPLSVLQRQIELKRVTESVHGENPQYAPVPAAADPAAPLSATELGQALGGVSDETVRQRERAGELFSILRPGRRRGREYPGFQAWTGIADQALATVLGALGASSSTAAYGFFTSPTELLGGLAPIEALHGCLTRPRDLDEETKGLLAASPEVRLKAVVKAAEAHAARQQ